MTSGKPEEGALISGIGITPISRDSGRSSKSLAIEAIRLAVGDAGLRLADIDGLATLPGPIAEPMPGFNGPDLYEIQDALGLSVGWHISSPQGAAQISGLIEAVMAVAAGLCNHAVFYRSWTESSARTTARRERSAVGLQVGEGPFGWLVSTGALSIANYAALHAQRHMHEYGTTKEQLGWIAVNARAAAARNPNAIFQEPMTLEDYLASRPVSSPLSLLDCDVPVDGGIAVVVSRSDARPDLRKPVRIESMATALGGRPLWEQRPDLTTMGAHDLGPQLWGRTALKPTDVDTAQLYDGFSIFTLLWLEGLGFCPPGESGPFVEGGERISPSGQLPLNTWGGQLSGGRLHGYGFVAEAVRQLRAEAGGRQLPKCEVAAVGVGGGPIAGAMLLTQ